MPRYCDLMTLIFRSPRSEVPMSRPVSVLDCPCALNLDPAPLAALVDRHGRQVAEEMTSRALEELARRLADLHEPRGRGLFAELCLPALRISSVAEHLGLREMSEAARHVATAASQADGVAVEATLHRLERAFDLAVTQIWSEAALF